MERFFLALLIFVPVVIGAHFMGAPETVVFFLAALAVVPLAKFIGEAVEELAGRTTPALGGLLSSTFGNATELIIGFLALRAGLIDVVKASLTGSIISNLLLVLGLAMLAGGWNREKQLFNKTAVLAGSSALFIAAIALVMPAIFLQTASGVSGVIVEDMSVWVSAALLLVYGAGLFFSLHTHKHLYTEEVGKYEPRWSVARSVLTLLTATLAVAWVSDILVGSIQPVIDNFGWSPLFVGVIFLAIVGNAAENFSAVLVARKNRMDLSLQIAIGSATQIAMVVAPLLVLAGLALHQPMNLIFNTFELVSIVLSVLIVNLVVADGESNWLEGVQLLASYAIIGVAFFFHP
jgi:Ca2+:H+ antiporter